MKEKGFIDGIIYDGESKLVLPKGFSYDKVLGINNKVDDSTLNILPQSLCIPQTKSLSCEKQIFIIPDNAITKTK